MDRIEVKRSCSQYEILLVENGEYVLDINQQQDSRANGRNKVAIICYPPSECWQPALGVAYWTIYSSLYPKTRLTESWWVLGRMQ